MLPAGLLQAERIDHACSAASKKRILEEAAQLLAAGQTTALAPSIFEKLLERERLGSTGFANGIALPHARINDINEPRGAFLRLPQGVDFDSMDGKPVDLIFALLVPGEATQEHLNLLAELARLFSDKALCDRIRQAADTQTILQLLTDNVPPNNHS